MQNQQSSSSDITSNVVTYDPQLIPPENSSFLERSFVCRFRCLLDNSSGFLALNFQGRLKYVHGQNKLSEDGTVGHPQLALFTVATPLQTPSILEIRSKTLIFQTKHKLDFTPLGVDTRGKVVLGYSEIEICMRGSGYQFIHAADMMYCADNHVRMIKTGESGLTVFRLLTKSNSWVWVQANARLVLKNGRPDFIVARQRALSNEEGEEHLRIRRTQLPFNFATGEALLYEVGPTLDPLADLPSAPKLRKVSPEELPVDPSSLLGCMLQQDQALYLQDQVPSPPPPICSLDDVAFKDSHALVNVPGGDTWQYPHPPTPSTGLVKEESTVQSMMETIQQIIGDSDLCSSLSVDPVELKDWEATLLRMSTATAGSCEFSDDLNDILNNDILTYVEEHLLEDANLPQLLDVPQPYLDPQGPGVLPRAEGFPWSPSRARQGLSGGLAAQDQGAIRVSLKLTHMGPQVDAARAALGFQLEFGATNGPGLGGMAGFGSPMAGPCDQAGLRPASKQNTYEPCPLRPTQPAPFSATSQIHPSQMGQPIPSQLQLGIPTQPMGFQGRSGVSQSNQSSQWICSALPELFFEVPKDARFGVPASRRPELGIQQLYVRGSPSHEAR
ncbi:aryl hydrocarbon receptor 2 [Aplochiton taeniatus]